jgi:hypothetical protein
MPVQQNHRIFNISRSQISLAILNVCVTELLLENDFNTHKFENNSRYGYVIHNAEDVISIE